VAKIEAARRRVVIGEDDPSVAGRVGCRWLPRWTEVLGVAEAFETSVCWLKARRRGVRVGEVLLSASESTLYRRRPHVLPGPSARGSGGWGVAVRGGAAGYVDVRLVGVRRVWTSLAPRAWPHGHDSRQSDLPSQRARSPSHRPYVDHHGLLVCRIVVAGRPVDKEVRKSVNVTLHAEEAGYHRWRWPAPQVLASDGC